MARKCVGINVRGWIIRAGDMALLDRSTRCIVDRFIREGREAMVRLHNGALSVVNVNRLTCPYDKT